jgi:hypothetical protein
MESPRKHEQCIRLRRRLETELTSLRWNAAGSARMPFASRCTPSHTAKATRLSRLAASYVTSRLTGSSDERKCRLSKVSSLDLRGRSGTRFCVSVGGL